jgi:hypothetical protein
MGSDSVTRTLLTLILVCLVALVIRGFSARSGSLSSPRADEDPGLGRYELSLMNFQAGKRRAPPRLRLVRTDTRTGQVWLTDDVGQEQAWIAMAESPPDPAREEVLALIEGLRTAYPPDFRAWAAEKLRDYDPGLAVPLLVAALEDDETAVVLGATRALAETGDPSALPALRGLLSHPDAGVRAAARGAIEALE